MDILKGMVFGELTIVKENPRKRLPSGQTNRAFLCKCSCGSFKEVRLGHLNHNKITSCGMCKRSKKGFVCYSGASKEYFYKVWYGIRTRCSSYHSDSHLYYDKGIRVCNEWKNYTSFRDWLNANGYKKGLHIDRIDSDKGYSPENCRVVTPRVNSNNKKSIIKYKYKGFKLPLSLLLDELGVPEIKYTIYCRIKRGWSVDKAIETPIREGNYKRGKRK